MKSKVCDFEILDKAYYDMQRLKEWYDFKRKDQGTILAKEIATYLKQIKKNPHAFEQKYKPFYVAFLKTHQVAIAYLYADKKITVFAVYSTYQNVKKILKH